MRLDADMRHIDSPEALQVYLGFLLRAPSWYGYNLDALYDILTEKTEDCTLIFHHGTMNEVMQAYWQRLTCVLDDAAQANAHFRWVDCPDNR